VLSLSDLSITPLAETRSIDDQAAWLSSDTVGYTLRGADGTPSVWAVPADGSGSPRKVRDDAESPAALGRPAGWLAVGVLPEPRGPGCRK